MIHSFTVSPQTASASASYVIDSPVGSGPGTSGGLSPEEPAQCSWAETGRTSDRRRPHVSRVPLRADDCGLPGTKAGSADAVPVREGAHPFARWCRVCGLNESGGGQSAEDGSVRRVVSWNVSSAMNGEIGVCEHPAYRTISRRVRYSLWKRHPGRVGARPEVGWTCH